MFSFQPDSALVKTWVQLLNNPDSSYSLQDVPDLFNLKEVLESILRLSDESNP